MTAFRLPAASLLLIFLSACSAQTMQPHFERNPHPTNAYRLRVVFKNPPGPLIPDEATAVYRIENLPCAAVEEHPTHANQPVADIPMTVKKTAENTYEGVFYADGIEDKDYYGKGICHWRIESPVLSFKASGKPEETNFVVTFSKDEVRDGLRTTIYYARMGYPRNAEMDAYNDHGTQDRAQYKLKDDEVFEADVTLDKVSP